ncbi:MAG: 16S rRNA (cytosine(1402)-N(4))-methyltransferase RsmH [Candidatus Aegiribacteria sp.]|nr:16S rRNA (cytosine(1402)-N(4))-methyltransferase RsmH [Candidatus Aegiribacteria sp.]
MREEKPAEDSQESPCNGIDKPYHVPVMADEVAEFFAGGLNEGLLVDGTAGAGGHLEMLSRALPRMSFLAVDRDPAAVSILRSRFSDNPDITVRQGSYTEIPEIINELGLRKASAALFDLGLSSIQLDDPSRGFSYRYEGPLDMRFDDSTGKTAAELLNGISEKEIADIIYKYGEEGRSRRIAKAIARNRPVNTTLELAEIINTSIRSRRNSFKILSRVFQALRIAVNGELDQLERLIDGLEGWTEVGARIAFITFHSIEDRKIKLLFRDTPGYRQHSPRWVVPGEDEVRKNSRARSARLRMGIRT